MAHPAMLATRAPKFERARGVFPYGPPVSRQLRCARKFNVDHPAPHP